MSISVAIFSRMGSEKALWSWSVSVKNNKFGSAKTNSTTVGGLVAVHSALAAIPTHLDVVFRSTDKKLVEILSNPRRKTTNPVILQIFKAIHERQGFVRALFVSPGSLTEEDKRAIKILDTISGRARGANSAKSSTTSTATRKPNSMLKPGAKKTVRATVTRKPRINQPLSTGLEDWDDTVPIVIAQRKGKPVLCDSCSAPISPLTNECLCSD